MEWYWIVLIVLGGAAFLGALYVVVAAVVAKGTLKSATTPVAHTLDEAREFQSQYENVNYADYDTVWRKQSFEVDGTHGKVRGEVIFNPACGDRPKVAVICHGHTWNRINSLKYAAIFYKLGYHAVIYDHAYFGLSDGNFTSLGYYERYDLSSVLDYVRGIFGKDAMVVLHGESMGAVTVLCELSLRRDLAAVIADCAFSNTFVYYRELCVKATHLPGFPVVDISNVMSKRKYGYDFAKVNPIDDVRSSDVPVCFIHGAADKFISPSHSEDMYLASPSPDSELHIVPSAGHARSYHADPVGYERILTEFLSKTERRSQQGQNSD